MSWPRQQMEVLSLRGLVMSFHVTPQSSLEFSGAATNVATELSFRQGAEPTLHQVDPGRPIGGRVQGVTRMTDQPALNQRGLVRAVVAHDQTHVQFDGGVRLNERLDPLCLFRPRLSCFRLGKAFRGQESGPFSTIVGNPLPTNSVGSRSCPTAGSSSKAGPRISSDMRVPHSLISMHAPFPHPGRSARGMQDFTIIGEKWGQEPFCYPENELRDGYGSPAWSWSIFTTTETRRLRGSLGSARLSGIWSAKPRVSTI